MAQARILDFDGSVAPLEGAATICLRDREESVRFSCSIGTLNGLPSFPAAGLTFLGSGDFHHVTYGLLKRLQRPVQLVVFDNHPDNMRYPFGIHCGSWVAHAARLPFITRIYVAGIHSGDVERAHVLENHLGFLRSGKVSYWCVRRDLRMLRRFGVRTSRSFDSTAALVDALSSDIPREPVYLSIDKDVLAPDVVHTNWDQGVMRFEELESAIACMRDLIVAADVVGDVSAYRYRNPFKRLLSAFDRQPEIDADSVVAWQAEHRKLNARLLTLLGPR